MELAISAIGSIFGGGGMAAGATTAATTAAGTAVGGTHALLGAGALNALSGISTALSVLGTIGSGAAAAREANQMADQATLEAGQEQLAGEQRKTKMSRELARVLGNNDVTFAAAGIDLTQGIASDAATRAKQQAASEISIDQQDTDFRRSLYRMRAAGYRDKAKSARGGALLGALGQVAGFGLNLKEQG